MLWRRQIRHVPAASERLDQQHARVHAPPQDVDVVALVREDDGLGRGDLEVAVGPALVTIREELERELRRVHRAPLLEGLLFVIDWPLTVVDSMCSILSTVVVRTRSKPVVIRPSISSGFKPVNCQATAITGMSMFGKMSVGVRRTTTGLAMRISSASTMNV